jgi:hypothetical protein
MRRTILLAALALSAGATPAAGRTGWRFLGDKTVDDSADHDTLTLAGDARYTSVRICVDNAPVRFYDVDVRFGNGGAQELRMADVIRPGGCTRAIDLKGGARDITKINFLYQAKTMGQKNAHIRVFGR